MKIIFISDIHGITKNLNMIKEKYNKENFDMLVVLGDLFYDGPKNKIVNEANVKVKEFLSSFKNIKCMKGNCDNNLFVDTLDIDIKYGIDMITIDDIDIYLSHGHIYNENNTSFFKERTGVLVYGHFHYPKVMKKDNMTYICVGSISSPRNGSKETYMVYENKNFTIYDVNNNIIETIKV